jgi:hypothetical protein
MLLGQSAGPSGMSGWTPVALVTVNLLCWGLFIAAVWLIFRRIGRWQRGEVSAVDRRRVAVSVGIKLAALVGMVFAGVFVAIGNQPVIASWPASLFCGSELLLAVGLVFWIWRDFGPPKAVAHPPEREG